MSQPDEHASHVAQAFGECLNAFLADAQALGMADGNHLDSGDLIRIGPTDI
jgi:hypothetical protein